jgi:acyl carrier protein
METQEVTTAEISGKVKQIIAHVANLDAAAIADGADLRADLKLDSLSLLEIGVDVDYAFKLGIPDLETQLAGLQTLPQVVALVERLLAEKAA